MTTAIEVKTPMGSKATEFKPTAATATTIAKPGRKPGSKKPENETPEQEFKRLCVPRVESALKRLRQLRNLSRLKPSDSYREKVISALEEGITALAAAWKGSAEKTEGFQL